MRIAQVAPPFETVPPAAYGGTERIVANLCVELARRGHDVTLFAAEGSNVSTRLVPTAERPLWQYDPPLQDFGPFWSTTIDTVWQHIAEFDIIHSHLDYWGFPLARAGAPPVVTTLHGRLDLPELQPLYRHFKDVPLISISDAQRLPVWWANFVATIYHGVELEKYTFNPRPDGYLAYLGRISPDKGLDTAIRIARRAGLPLKVAARLPLAHKHDPSVQADWAYYEQVIEPLLERHDVECVGELTGSDKDIFLGGADALLFPICWPEPFGLVMIEALACGTPVLALDYGSVPEVLENGYTGFIGHSEDDLVRAVRCLAELDRAACRAEAERRFSSRAMAEAYEDVYMRLLARHAPASMVQLDRPFEPDRLAGSDGRGVGTPA